MPSADGRIIPKGDYGVFSIQDTGAGMSTETQRQLFVPFFTTQATGQGIGLGLAAANGLLLQNDAFVTFTSALGEGSAFTVWIPVNIAREHVVRAESAEPFTPVAG
jgi:signal transduction histidine kinase